MTRTTAIFDDFRDALRILHRSPRTAITVWLVLTLSLSAATVVFTVADHVALRSLPFSDPDRLIAISRVAGSDGSRWTAVSPQDYVAWAEQAPALENVAASAGWSPLRLSLGGEDIPLVTQRLTTTFLHTVGVSPVLGRGFTEAEATPGQDSVVVLSDHVWRQHFDGDPSVLGRMVKFGNQTREVVGIMPSTFSYPLTGAADSDVWIPFTMQPRDRDPAHTGRGYMLHLVARLAPGATLAQAQTQVSQITADMEERYSQSYWKNARPVLLPLRDAVVGPAGGWLLLALGAVGVVVLLASANIANLLLARVGHRARELAVRSALGASPSQLRRLVACESLIVASLAGVTALALTWAGIHSVVSWLPDGIARVSAISVDGRILAVALAATAVTGLLAGLVPAHHAAGADVTVLLRAGALPAGGRARAVLVVAQVAFAVVLVFATTTFVVSFIKLVTTDLGFDYENRVAFSVPPSRLGVSRDGTPEEQRLAVDQMFDELLAKVEAVPGVQSAGYIDSGRPLGGSWSSYAVRTDDMSPGDAVSLDLHQISAGYQAAAGLRLVEGRPLRDADRSGAPLVMMLSEPAATRLFPGQSALGQTLDFRGRREVVGVVEGVRLIGPEAERRMAIYLPAAQSEVPDWSRDLVVRSAGSVEAVMGPVADVIQPFLSPGQSLPAPEAMTDAFNKITASRRFQTRLMAAFGGFALLIGAFGVYSVISALVVQQTKEIGVRMALGASGTRIIRMVLRHTLTLVAVGVGAGLFASRLLTGWVSALVFETQPASAPILGVVVLVVVGAASISALAPALRAARIDPIRVLRAE